MICTCTCLSCTVYGIRMPCAAARYVEVDLGPDDPELAGPLAGGARKAVLRMRRHGTLARRELLGQVRAPRGGLWPAGVYSEGPVWLLVPQDLLKMRSKAETESSHARQHGRQLEALTGGRSPRAVHSTRPRFQTSAQTHERQVCPSGLQKRFPQALFPTPTPCNRSEWAPGPLCGTTGRQAAHARPRLLPAAKRPPPTAAPTTTTMAAQVPTAAPHGRMRMTAAAAAALHPLPPLTLTAATPEASRHSSSSWMAQPRSLGPSRPQPAGRPHSRRSSCTDRAQQTAAVGSIHECRTVLQPYTVTYRCLSFGARSSGRDWNRCCAVGRRPAAATTRYGAAYDIAVHTCTHLRSPFCFFMVPVHALERARAQGLAKAQRDGVGTLLALKAC